MSEATAEQSAAPAAAERLPVGPERKGRTDLDVSAIARLHSMAGNGAIARLARGSMDAHDRLSLVRSELDRPGEPLDADVRTDAERRFGRELPDVRVHRNSDAADAVNARAFTVGHHIVLGPRVAHASSEAGRAVLVHELTHVLQQRTSRPPSLSLVPPSATAERQAASAAAGAGGASAQPSGIARIVEKDVTRLNDAELQAEYELTQRWISEHPDGADYDAGVSYMHEIEQVVSDRAAASSSSPPATTATTQASSSTAAASTSGGANATTPLNPSAAVETGTGEAFNGALNRRDFSTAARALAEMSADDRRRALEALTPEARQRLRTASAELDPSETNPIPGEIEAAEQASGQRTPTTTDARSDVVDVASMSGPDKLLRAWGYAEPHIGADVGEQLAGLFTPESIAIMAGFALAYVVAQATPVGWVADGIALATMGITAIFMGRIVLDVASDLWKFFGAISATTDDELRADGEALAHGIAEGGVALVIAILTHAIGGRGGGAAEPYEPPPPGYVDVLTDEAGLVRAPVEAIDEMPVTDETQVRSEGGGSSGTDATSESLSSTSGSSDQSMSSSADESAAASSSESSSESSSSSSSERSRSSSPLESPVRGEEVFAEISAELDLDPASVDTVNDPAAAVSDAQEAGFVGSTGQAGSVDLALQPHSAATDVRGAYGVSGADVQSAHVGPTSFLRETSGYSRGRSLTVLLERSIHAAFDQYWKDWAMDQRRAGNTTCTVGQMYSVMLDAIEQIPSLAQRTKNALAMRLQLEIFRDLNLQPTDTLELPYRNIPKAE